MDLEIHPYFIILILVLLGVAFSGTFVAVSNLFNPKKTKTDLSVYECGVPVIASARDRFSVKFFLVAMLFILFDVEVVFLIPWAVLFETFIKNKMGIFIFIEMMLFIGILALGLVYVIKRGALDWSGKKA